jgi:hypothetical protein
LPIHPLSPLEPEVKSAPHTVPEKCRIFAWRICSSGLRKPSSRQNYRLPMRGALRPSGKGGPILQVYQYAILASRVFCTPPSPCL